MLQTDIAKSGQDGDHRMDLRRRWLQLQIHWLAQAKMSGKLYLTNGQMKEFQPISQIKLLIMSKIYIRRLICSLPSSLREVAK